jgi:hypothetical protein
MGILLRVTSNGVLGMERMRRMLSHGIVLPGLKGGHGILGHCDDNAFLAGRGGGGRVYLQHHSLLKRKHRSIINTMHLCIKH